MDVCLSANAELEHVTGQGMRFLLVGDADGDGWRAFASRLKLEVGVECCRNVQEAGEFLRCAGCRTVVLDWPRAAPGSNVIDQLRVTRALLPGVGLIAATATQAVEERVQALEAGVDDCVTYEIVASELWARMLAIERRRNLACPPRADQVQERARMLARTFRLSSREHETLQLLAQGIHLKEVANTLGCGYSTARTHIRRVCHKLGCSGTREAIIKLFAFEMSPRVYPNG